MKKVLVIGGSYFIGRVFCILADRTGRFDITLLNRGRYPMKGGHITQHIADRHDALAMRSFLRDAQFDTIVDFCAYEPGDSSTLLRELAGKETHYILISSAAVLKPSAGKRTEQAACVDAEPRNPVEEYSYHKMLLEKETMAAHALHGVDYTILRPCMVYGPFNYAPRESWYFDLMLKNELIPVPTDAHAKFQIVYVKDIAEAIMACTCSATARNEIYNLAAPEELDYGFWMDFLETLGLPFETYPVDVATVYRKNLPLPFPLDQNELFDGRKITAELGVEYTPFDVGMRNRFESYKNAFG